MSESLDLLVTPFVRVSEVDARALAALFDACHCPCFCRYWHFPGDKNDWLYRCSAEPDTSRDALVSAAQAGSDEARGVVARLGDAIVGWMKLTPAPAVRKLYEQRYYRGLPGLAGDGVMAIGCTLVHPDHRRRGVTTALVRGAVAAARAWGASAIEAFPREVSAEVSDEELWMGPSGAYARAGFVPYAGESPYAVMRLSLL